MVSQFISPDEVRLLGDLNFDFPEGTHAIGRLDGNSEGLLILTTDKSVTRLLFQGEVPHKRTYLVLVRNIVTKEELYQLRNGISIKIKGGNNWITTPCEVEIVEKPKNLFKGQFELHKSQLHTWLLISLTEGKFHQVRKMVAAVHHRCLRLIRLSIEDLELGNLQPSEVKEINEDDFFTLLKIKNRD